MFKMYCESCGRLVEFENDDESQRCDLCGSLCTDEHWFCSNCNGLQGPEDDCSREGNCKECYGLLEDIREKL